MNRNPSDYLTGQRQRSVPNLAVRQRLLKFFNALIGDLRAAEAEVLLDLILARLATSVTVAASRGGANPHHTISEGPAWDLLERLLTGDVDAIAVELAAAGELQAMLICGENTVVSDPDKLWSHNGWIILDDFGLRMLKDPAIRDALMRIPPTRIIKGPHRFDVFVWAPSHAANVLRAP